MCSSVVGYVNEMMWFTQDVLHKKKQVVPGTMMLLVGALFVCCGREQTHPDWEDHFEEGYIKSFLFLIILQMLPLVALEMKIMQCADPVGLFCMFATPVTLIHACFMGMRFLLLCNQHEGVEGSSLWYYGAGVVVAFWIMHKAYGQSIVNICQNTGVWMLVYTTFAAAFAVSALDGTLIQQATWNLRFLSVLETSHTYVEIAAFVPAVLMVYGEDFHNLNQFQKGMDTKRTATAFFLFLIGFYVREDLYHAYEVYQLSWHAAAAHLAHFFLLVDFGCYILAHIYNPDKLMDDFRKRKWLPTDDSYFV